MNIIKDFRLWIVTTLIIFGLFCGMTIFGIANFIEVQKLQASAASKVEESTRDEVSEEPETSEESTEESSQVIDNPFVEPKPMQEVVVHDYFKAMNQTYNSEEEFEEEIEKYLFDFTMTEQKRNIANGAYKVQYTVRTCSMVSDDRVFVEYEEKVHWNDNYKKDEQDVKIAYVYVPRVGNDKYRVYSLNVTSFYDLDEWGNTEESDSQ